MASPTTQPRGIDPRLAGAGLAATAGIVWGGMFPVAAGVVSEIDAVNLTVLRYLLAVPVLVALLVAFEGRGAVKFEGRFLRLFWLGTLGFAGFNLVAYLALEFTEPQNVALVTATAPLITALVRWARDGVRPARGVIAMMIVALIGVAMVLGDGDPTLIVREGPNSGDILVVIGVISWVFYTLGAADHRDISPLRYTTLTAVGGLITLLIVAAVVNGAGWRELPAASVLSDNWVPMIYLVLGGAVVGVLAWNEGVRRIGPSLGALFVNLIPVTTFAIQMARGEEIHTGQLVGAALTIGAVIVANRIGDASSSPAPPPAAPRAA